MFIKGGFEGFDGVTDFRARTYWVYQLQADATKKSKAPVPEEFQVFYVGLTNNPIARLLEHQHQPHSGALQAFMTNAKYHGWVISMHLLYGTDNKEAAERAEAKTVRKFIDDGNFSLMNMEGLEGPVNHYIEMKLDEEAAIAAFAAEKETKVLDVFPDHVPLLESDN